MMFWIFVGALALTGLMRLVELAVSVRRMRRAPERVVAEPRLFPWMVALHVGLVFGPLVEVVALGRQPWWPVSLAAGIGLLGATAMRFWTLSTLGASWNVRVVEPRQIVVTGPYAYIRHPNYLVVTVEILALPLLHGAWIAAVALSLLNAVILGYRIRTEEAVLLANPAWRRAFEGKARFIPGIF